MNRNSIRAKKERAKNKPENQRRQIQKGNTFSNAFFKHQNNYPGLNISGNKNSINQQLQDNRQ